MAPWPEQGNEPKAPDKSCSKSGDSSLSDSSKVNSGTTEDLEVNVTANKNDDKQTEDKNPDVSNLDDGQLKALLDEAITYKRPKDREGKSDLFRELLQEAEADESECGDGRRGGAVAEQVVPVSGSRYYSNSNRRRGRRDPAVSERQTRGGSLQNLVHAFNSEFDTSGFGYFGQSSGHSGGVGRRKSKRGNGGRDYGVSVSARQREGGSLPSNVNVGGAGGGMLTLSGLEFPPTAPLSTAATAALLFDDACGYASASKQNKQRKELGHTLSANEFTTAMPVHSSTNVSYQAGGETPNNVSKAEFMVVDLGDVGENGQETKSNSVVVGDNVVDGGGGKGSASANDTCSNGVDEELGTEMEVIQRSETTRVPNYTSRATLEVGLGDCSAKNKNLAEHGGDVDTTVAFPLGSIQQCEEGSGVVNGVEQTPLQLPSSYNSVKCIVGSTNNSREDRNSNVNKGSDIVTKQHSSGAEANKSTASAAGSMLHSVYPMQHVSVLSIPPTRWIATSLGSDSVNRLTFHGNKETSGDGKNKSLDENGNAVNQNFRLESINSNDRKGKTRRMKTNNDRNVIMSQNIEGHRGDKDIESLIKFIESNSETKGKTKNNSTHSNGPVGFSSKQQRNNVKREEVVGGTKTRKEKAVEEGHEEEKSSGKSRVGGKNSKENRTGDKVGNGGQLKKSNSLEEISKTKLEDLTSVQSGSNSTSSTSTSSGQVTLRRPKKQATLDEEELFGERSRTAERRSWGTEESQPYYCSDGPATVSADEGGPSASGGRKRRTTEEKRRMEEGIPALVVSTANVLEETEFHVVTKKKTRKKRRSSSGGRTGSGSGGHGGLFGDENRRPMGSHYGQSYYQHRGDAGGYYQRKNFNPGNGNGFPPHDRMVEREGGGVMLYHQYRHHHRPRSPEHLRRKSTSSMPPSDKSDSSDLDSVHSLPVSSTTPKLTLDQTSTSSGSTPQASYADITRMASSNVSSSSSTQGSCNMNAGKWPAVTSKNQAVPSPTTSSSPSTATTTTVSSTSTFNSASTATTTSNTTNTMPVPALTVPLVPNNPQFITGPRLNIGVPPVSGSKATASTSASSTNTTNINSSNYASSSVSGSSSIGEASAPMAASSSDSGIVSKHRNSPLPLESRTKKDAMTSTTLDNKLVPSEEHNPGPKSQGAVNKTTEVQVAPSNVIMDQYYPSLEESLVSDKADRKPGRSGNSSVHNASTRAPLEETPSSNVVSFNVAANPENCGNKGPRLQEVSDDVRLNPQPVEVSVEATVIVPRSNSCTAAELVPSEVPVASAAATVMNRSKEVTGRSKSGGGRKLSAAGSNVTVATSSVRPPVIIMDEQEQEATFRENIGTVSELTFGFEVNEQLLLSDGDDNSGSASTELPSVVEGNLGNVALEEMAPAVPMIASSATEDFSARYREPVTEQSESHDTIVAYVGNAWDAVVKEMNAPVQAGGKVQYYSGQ